MQNKKPLLKRLFVIYITFAFVLVVGCVQSIIPQLMAGVNTGSELGEDLVENYTSERPNKIYMLGNIPVHADDNVRFTPAGEESEVKVIPGNIALMVKEQIHDASVWKLAFSSVGGSPWIYFMTMLCPILYLATIVLMFLIINSLRRSIRDERPLDERNVWRLRSIGILVIAAELIQNLTFWYMARRAAMLLEGSVYKVDTSLHVSYSMIIMGIIVIFAAEVFAIGRNLSEEQRLTI